MSKKYYERVLRGTGVQSKKFHSSFGASILKKFGWEDGDGLGKERTGMLDPLQIKRRTELLGLGAEEAQQSGGQWNNWWDGLYNSTVKKIRASKHSRDKKNDPVPNSDLVESASSSSEGSLSDDSVSSRSLSLRPQIKPLSSNDFKQRFVADDSPCNRNKSDCWGQATLSSLPDRKLHEKRSRSSTHEHKDDELLKACDGRTGRRADRQRGKLERIKLAEKAHSGTISTAGPKSTTSEITTPKKMSALEAPAEKRKRGRCNNSSSTNTKKSSKRLKFQHEPHSE